MMVVKSLLGKVESKAVHLSQYAHLLRDDGDESKRNMEAAEEEQHDIEDKETGPGGKEMAPIYMKPRAPSVRDDEDDDHEQPLATEFLREEMKGKGEEMLRVALAPGEENRDGLLGDFGHRRSARASAKGHGTGMSAGTMKKLSDHPAVPSLSTTKLSSAGDGKGQMPSAGAASSREGGRSARSGRQSLNASAGSQTAR
jgi:hypothetical protein